MSNKNPFAISEGKRVKITNEQKKEIRKMYREASKEIKERERFLESRTNISSVMRRQYLDELSNEIKDNMSKIDRRTGNVIKRNMEAVSESILRDNQVYLEKLGFSQYGVSGRLLFVPNDIVNHVMSGKLYEGKWTLSKSIWGDDKQKLKEIDTIIAKGIAQNKSAFDIAKDLERYVNPVRRKPWDWGKVYPGVRKKIDYNAQRLARTMVSHAYEESFVRATIGNPFVDAYIWEASGGDRMCQICEERDGQIYQKNELPLDHPNGMCTFIIVQSKSMEEVGKDLANWFNGVGDKSLNAAIDRFAEQCEGY